MGLWPLPLTLRRLCDHSDHQNVVEVTHQFPGLNLKRQESPTSCVMDHSLSDPEPAHRKSSYFAAETPERTRDSGAQQCSIPPLQGIRPVSERVLDPPDQSAHQLSTL